MCGIFGYAKKHNSQNDKQIEILQRVFTNLAKESVIRGEDSTGISMISPSSRKIFKSIAKSSDVVKDNTWNDNILGLVNRDSTVAIGHVRLATHGDVTTRNAHPFEIGDVIGAHNGVIYNYNQLSNLYNKDMEVDSEIIFASLNNMSMDKALEQLDGDFAVSWVKDSNKIVHLARESSRPISVAYWKKAKVLLWASTSDILTKAMKDAGLNLQYAGLKSEYIYTFDTDMFGRKYRPTKTKFTAMEKANSKYGITSYNWIDYSDYTKNSYTDSFDVNNMNKECVTCGVYWTKESMIEVDDADDYICLDCFEDVDNCDYCGDWEFKGDLTHVLGYDICQDCDTDFDMNVVQSNTSCQIVEA